VNAVLFKNVNTAEDVTAVLRTMYGSDLSGPAGVMHVAAVWHTSGRGFVTLRINSETPKSAHDYFVLNLARARADAIITSGRILREEPELTHEISGPAGTGVAIASWRREVARKSVPPTSLVLTSGRHLDLDHPIFHGAGSKVVFTTPKAAASLRGREVKPGIRIVGRSEVGPREAVEFLLKECGAETVSIELGPSSSRALYDRPSLVDELLLSILDTPTIPEPVVGRPFIDATTLDRVLSTRSSPFRVGETRGSGEWTFVRYAR
jgi:riboflavin biosynthesis pyrimidine reductase